MKWTSSLYPLKMVDTAAVREDLIILLSVPHIWQLVFDEF
jgi:hypothetical protein